MNQAALNNYTTNSLSRNSVFIGVLYFVELILLFLIAFRYYKTSIIITVIIFSIFLLYLFFNKPFILLPTFLLSILAGTLETFNKGSKISFIDILFPILILILVINFFQENNENSGRKYLLIKFLYGFFLIWSLFTVLIAVNKPLALAYWRNYFGGFAIFVYALMVVNNLKQIKTFLSVLVVWGVVLAFIEFYILFSLGSISTGLMKLFLTKNLLATSWGKSNYLAAFYVLIIPITIGYLFSIKSKIGKIIISVSILVMFSAIILTLSRGGILSLSIAIIFLMIKILKPRTLIPILSLIILVAVILALNPLTYALFEGLGKVERSFSYFSRLNFYQDVWNTFLAHPITGVGLANLGYYSVFTITTSVGSAHNIVLGTLGETGIVGAMLFISLLIYSLIRSLKNYIKEKNERIRILQWSFFCAFIGVFVHSMMEPNFEGFQFAVMFWSTLAVFLRLADLNDKDKSLLSGISSSGMK